MRHSVTKILCNQTTYTRTPLIIFEVSISEFSVKWKYSLFSQASPHKGANLELSSACFGMNWHHDVHKTLSQGWRNWVCWTSLLSFILISLLIGRRKEQSNPWYLTELLADYKTYIYFVSENIYTFLWLNLSFPWCTWRTKWGCIVLVSVLSSYVTHLCVFQ